MKKLIVLLLLVACNNNTGRIPTETVLPVPTAAECTVSPQVPYHNYRLRAVSSCSVAVGRVVSTKLQRDNDWTADLQCVNVACQNLVAGTYPTLHIEFDCAGGSNPPQADAVATCQADPKPWNLNNVPQVGDCILVTGRGVVDMIHGNGEIHPVGSWQKLDSTQCDSATMKSYDMSEDDRE